MTLKLVNEQQFIYFDHVASIVEEMQRIESGQKSKFVTITTVSHQYYIFKDNLNQHLILNTVSEVRANKIYNVLSQQILCPNFAILRK